MLSSVSVKGGILLQKRWIISYPDFEGKSCWAVPSLPPAQLHLGMGWTAHHHLKQKRNKAFKGSLTSTDPSTRTHTHTHHETHMQVFSVCVVSCKPMSKVHLQVLEIYLYRLCVTKGGCKLKNIKGCVGVFTHCISSLAGSHTQQRERGVGTLRGGGWRGQSCAVYLGIRLRHTWYKDSIFYLLFVHCCAELRVSHKYRYIYSIK